MSHLTEHLSQNTFASKQGEAGKNLSTTFSNDLGSTSPVPLADHETILKEVSAALDYLDIFSVSFFHRSVREDIDHSLQKAFSVNLKQALSLTHLIKHIQFDVGLEYFNTRLSSPEPFFLRTTKTLGHDNSANNTQEQGLYIVSKAFGPFGRSGVFIFSVNPEQVDPDHKVLTPTQNVTQLFFPQLLKSLRVTEKPAPLTPREKEIVKWISRGKSNPDIAQIIGISVHTVNGYLRGIYLKTQTGDRVSLSFYAFHNGLLS